VLYVAKQLLVNVAHLMLLFNPFTADPVKALTERQSARMSKIKNGGLDQYGAETFEQQQFGTAGVEGVNAVNSVQSHCSTQRTSTK